MKTSLQGNKAARKRIIKIPAMLMKNITQKMIASPSTESEHGAPWKICLNNGEILEQLATSNVDLNAGIITRQFEYGSACILIERKFIPAGHHTYHLRGFQDCLSQSRYLLLFELHLCHTFQQLCGSQCPQFGPEICLQIQFHFGYDPRIGTNDQLGPLFYIPRSFRRETH